MKRTIVFLVAIVAITVLGTSCKSHERCPAYGKAPVNQDVNIKA